jgi:hypothetical protein
MTSKLKILPDDLADYRVISLAQAGKISSLSPDTIRRRYGHLIRQLSPRRQGMRLRDVLAIGNPESTKDSVAA